MIFLNKEIRIMIKEKYKQFHIHTHFGGIYVIPIHNRWLQGKI